MLFKGNTLLGILGFSISSGIGSESIKNYATVGSLVTFIVIYICYCVLSFSFMIPVCGKELIQIIKGKGEGLYSKLKLRIWILTMRLENSIPGNDSVVNVH